MSRVPSHSPWGVVQDSEHVAEGMVIVDTPGHGGLWLDKGHALTLMRLFHEWTPWTASFQWLEEDADVAVAMVVWPELFTPKQVGGAIEHIGRAKYFKDVAAWLAGPGGGNARTRAAELAVAE